MRNWQKERNYRKSEAEGGHPRYVITVDGEDVEVGAGVYEAYARADRRERYIRERDAGRLLSLERLIDDGAPLESLSELQTEPAESSALHGILEEEMADAFLLLTPEEQDLIRALVIDGMAERDYAAQIGISQKNINKKKQRILKKLKKLLP
jgi:RNA polymerase sigma factor (sigma-70 family)